MRNPYDIVNIWLFATGATVVALVAVLTLIGLRRQTVTTCHTPKET